MRLYWDRPFGCDWVQVQCKEVRKWASGRMCGQKCSACYDKQPHNHILLIIILIILIIPPPFYSIYLFKKKTKKTKKNTMIYIWLHIGVVPRGGGGAAVVHAGALLARLPHREAAPGRYTNKQVTCSHACIGNLFALI